MRSNNICCHGKSKKLPLNKWPQSHLPHTLCLAVLIIHSGWVCDKIRIETNIIKLDGALIKSQNDVVNYPSFSSFVTAR